MGCIWGRRYVKFWMLINGTNADAGIQCPFESVGGDGTGEVAGVGPE